MSRYNKFAEDPFAAHKKIVEFVGKNKKVLDVGCATGEIAKKLSENGCEVYGIELNSESANHAKKYCKKVIVMDIDSNTIENLPFSEKYFDVIVFADILEHLKKPSKTLKIFRRYLKNEGSVVASVPNIANWTIRLKLLRGNFDYEKTGLLDETHLRFFTRKTAKLLFVTCAFDVKFLDFTPSFPLPLSSKNKYFLAKINPNLFARQFLIVAKKVD